MIENIDEIILIFATNINVRKIFSPICYKSNEEFDKKFVINEDIHKRECFDELLTVLSDFVAFNNRFDNLIKENFIISKSKFEKVHYFLINIKDLNTNELSAFELKKCLYLKLLATIFISTSFREFKYSDDKVKKYSGLIIDGARTWYRGHSDYNYNLIPSMYRNVKLNKTNFGINEIIDLYTKSNLLAKYKETINSNAQIDYETCAFFQHSASYSPFLDFTSNLNIALIFATAPQNNINNYYNNDSALILLSIKPKNGSIIQPKNISVEIFNDKLKYNTLVYGYPLYKLPISMYVPSFSFCDKPTNDRMRYQSGSFLCFDRGIFVKGIPLIPFSEGLFLKFKIESHPKKGLSKEDIYNFTVSSYHYFDMEYLMDPYLYFSKFSKK